jgi:hypothetical protein
MKKGQFTSRAIIATNYDSVANSLFVTFKNGAEYVYYKVPLETYIGMICCPSIGDFFRMYIRDVYTFKKTN